MVRLAVNAGRHDAGESLTRAIVAIACSGGALLLVALASAMDRWMIG